MINQFSTRQIEPFRRLDAWNEVMDSAYAGLSATPLRSGFSARIARWQLGDVVLTRPQSSAVALERRHRSDRQPVERTLKLHVFHAGTGRLLHRGRETVLRQGDLVACAAEENYRFDMQGDHELLIVEMDHAMLGGQGGWVDDIIGHAIARETVGARLMHDFLLSLWREGQTLDSSAPSDALGKVLVDMALAALKPSLRMTPSLQTPLWQRARAVIERRIGNSDLTPATLAQELGVGLRSLQATFAAQGTTPGAYIAEQRLLLGQQMLLAHKEMAITQIAFDCGFEDSGYFSRRFRQRFGLSPAQFRLRH